MAIRNFDTHHSVSCSRCGRRDYSDKLRNEYPEIQGADWLGYIRNEAEPRGWIWTTFKDHETGEKKNLHFCPTCVYREMFPSFYKDYLASDYFQNLRKKRLARDGYKCVKCGTAMNLQVHHINYEHMGRPDEEIDDLITVCNKCHEEIHEGDIERWRSKKPVKQQEPFVLPFEIPFENRRLKGLEVPFKILRLEKVEDKEHNKVAKLTLEIRDSRFPIKVEDNLLLRDDYIPRLIDFFESIGLKEPGKRMERMLWDEAVGRTGKCSLEYRHTVTEGHFYHVEKYLPRVKEATA